MKRQQPEEVTSPLEAGHCFSYEEMNINSTFQRLWTELSVFMRNHIYAEVLDLPNKEVVAERLFQLPGDFRNNLQLFYGPQTADKFGEIFTNFISRAMRVMEGVKANNQQAVDQAVREWYQIADETARYLARNNLFWDENQWRLLLYQYINLKNQMIIAIAAGKYQEEIKIYDRVFDLTSIMGSYLARGLIASQLFSKKR